MLIKVYSYSSSNTYTESVFHFNKSININALGDFNMFRRTNQPTDRQITDCSYFGTIHKTCVTMRTRHTDFNALKERTRDILYQHSKMKKICFYANFLAILKCVLRQSNVVIYIMLFIRHMSI